MPIPGFIESEWSRYNFSPERLLKMQSGADIINNFLRLVLNQGLLSSELLSAENLMELSTRLVDTQIPSAARKVKSFIDQPLTPERLDGFRFELRFLGNLARLLLKFDECSLPMKLEIWQLCGGTISKDLVLKQTGLRDHWKVRSIQVSREDSLVSRKTWLQGQYSGMWVFMMDYSFGNQPLPDEPGYGVILDQAAHFYPGMLPGRVLLSDTPILRSGPLTGIPVFSDISMMRRWLASMSAKDPFLQEQPLTLQQAVLACHEDQFYLIDNSRQLISIDTPTEKMPFVTRSKAWLLYAEAGGRPSTFTLIFSKGRFYLL